MKNWLKIGVIGLLALGALAVGFTGAAYAQEDTNQPEETEAQVWLHGRRGGLDPVALEAAAQVLGMTPDELSTQLWGGKTLADLAEEKGVALEDVQAAVEAAHEQAFKDRIAQAVTDGEITQEHADWLLEGLEKGFIGGHGFGKPGFGGHGLGGRGGFPGAAPVIPSGDA